MNILINASNLKVGGGVQVADSICSQLIHSSNHCFVVVLSRFMDKTAKRIASVKNVRIVRYDVRNTISTLLLGRDKFLDRLVEEEGIDAVLTIFGPSRWNPKCLHVSGFAMSHLVLLNSPYFQRMSRVSFLKNKLRNRILTYFFKRSSNVFYTENAYISKKWELLISGGRVYTVSNYYNQVYDHPDAWVPISLPCFDGITLLTVTACYPHKNLPISIEISKILKSNYPDFKFRFVFTIEEKMFPVLDEAVKEHFVFLGHIDITQCPSLYQQSDIMFQPTLLECFTATYPEAMRMECPIVTTDIEFSRGLCGDAAVYYSPLSGRDAADAIYRVGTDRSLRNELIKNGKNRLRQFDTYEQRATKLITILEQEYIHNK